MNRKLRLLAIRNDRLGDFMLAWPALQTLYRNVPEGELTVLARAYTAPLAPLCRGVNAVICDPARPGAWANARVLARLTSAGSFDASISFFSRFDTALALALAGIPVRVAPATKLAQLLYTHRLRQRRSRSDRPEYVYNLELAEYLLRLLGIAAPVRAGPPYLEFPAEETQARRAVLRERLGLPADKPWAFLHPGHGGSAIAPRPDFFARIARAIHASGASVVISAGPADAEPVAALAHELDGMPFVIYRSDAGLVEYARTLACADLFVAGSTGPLHIAGALNRPTVAFYPRRRSASAVRWETLNESSRRLAYMPPSAAAEGDFEAIETGPVVRDLMPLLWADPGRGCGATDPRT